MSLPALRFNLWRKSGRLPGAVLVNFLPIGLLACLDRVAQAVLLAINHIPALFDDVVRYVTGVFAQIRCLLLQELSALVGLPLQDFAGFLARFRREKQADAHANSQSEEKVCQSVFVHLLPPKVIHSILRSGLLYTFLQGGFTQATSKTGAGRTV